ncbi:MAG TPA: hypothetical protein VKA68_05695 [bacterium]|nr:hypothetical protein [bacterium]
MNYNHTHYAPARSGAVPRTSCMPGSRVLLVTLLTFLFMFLAVNETQAQFIEKWMAVGDFHARYSSAAAWAEFTDAGSNWYPGLYDAQGYMRGQGLWIATTDWDPGDVEPGIQPYDVKVAHRGPREPGFDQFHNMEMTVTSRFEPPKTFVNGLETFDKPIFNDAVDPDMKADRKLYVKANTAVGVTVEQTVYAFSQEYHDNYHIIEYVLTNSGNTDDDEDIELEGQNLTGVMIGWIHRWNASYKAAGLPDGVGWGRQTMNDVVGDGNKTYDRDFHAVYAWAGHYPPFQRWNTIGDPQITNQGWETATADSIGRMVGSGFVGRATIQSDVPDEGGEADKPSTSNWIGSDNPLTAASSQFNRSNMSQEYDYLTAGHVYPFHGDIVEPPDPAYGLDGVLDPDEWKQRFANQYNVPNFNADPGGISTITAYGPYDLDFGESVTIVVVEGVDGISWTHNYVIGYAYKRAFDQYGFPDADTSEFSFAEAYAQAQNLETPVLFPQDGLDISDMTEPAFTQQLTKNEWVMTGRDSLMDMFDAAIDNYNNGFDIPRPPMPPKEFHVTSGTDKVTLEWTTYGSDPPGGWEVYRTRTNIDSPFVKVATLEGSEHSWEDTEAQRGLDYFYYLQAVGAPTTEPYAFRNTTTHAATPRTVTLRSSRYYAQTYAPASLRRPATSTLDSVRVVPNPYNLASEESIRWPDRQDKMGFLNVPGYCTIKIYTEVGELIRTIEHTDGSGDEYWDMTTDYTQLVVSGIYFAVIQEQDAQGNMTGNKIIRKFTVIR